MKRTIGIFGGLGPAAGAYFFERFTRMTPARRDQDHPEVLLLSRPSVPDRSAFLLGTALADPLPALIEGVQWLERGGAQVIAIPCVTAHHFHEEMQQSVSVPILNLLWLCAESLQRAGVRRAALLATEGTYASGRFAAVLAQAGISTIHPNDSQKKAVMSLIYSIKAGVLSQRSELERLMDSLRAQGAERIVLGCTELSLLFRGQAVSGVCDPLHLLAEALLECSHFDRINLRTI